MSGFTLAFVRGSVMPVPNCIEVLLGKSTTINPGDVLILTTNSTYTGTGASQFPVVRPLLSGDTVTTSNGIVGVALFGAKTDSSGILTSMTSPVTVDTRGKIEVNNLYLNDLPTDPDSGYLRIEIASFDADNVFRGLTTANDVADFYTVGRSAGITASAATFPSNYTIDVGAASANSPLIVDGVNTEHAQFNSANGGGMLFVHCNPAFNQNSTGTLWST